MKKTLRLDLYQETACYKKPMAFKVGETYPLPPYSTVKGMLHALIDATSFIPMRISVQGKYDSQFVDYQKHYLFKKLNHPDFPLILDGVWDGYKLSEIEAMPLYVHLLYDVTLVIHVEAEEEIIEKIIAAIDNGKQISLGRWEDLVRIDNYEIVEVNEAEEGKNKYPIYIPKEKLDDSIIYVPYSLNWKYEIVHGIRKWEKILVGYVQENEEFEECLVDSYGDIVFYNV